MSRKIRNKLERWWIQTAVHDRVLTCKAVGLPGRVGSKRFKDLTKEEKEALRD